MSHVQVLSFEKMEDAAQTVVPGSTFTVSSGHAPGGEATGVTSCQKDDSWFEARLSVTLLTCKLA